MQAISLLMLALAAGVFAGPFKKEACSETCLNRVNECGVPYGGCWNECDQPPNFTASLCHTTPASDLVVTSTVTETAVVTEIVILNGTRLIKASSTTPITTLHNSGSYDTTCNTGVTECRDYFTKCGEEKIMYGGCHDACSPISYTPPPCAVPYITASYNTTRSTKSKTKRPAVTRMPCADRENPWMCAPDGW